MAAAILAAAGCATTTNVDMNEPRRLVATENGVRIDAEVRGETLAAATQIPINYDITNNRNEAIAVAELVADSSYDDETGIVTVALGSEVPGEQFLPRLAMIRPGEKRSFAALARINVPVAEAVPGNPFHRYPSGLRIRLNFLGDARPFGKLIGLSERVVHDPALAAELFPRWVEENESVITNALPMRWIGARSQPEEAPQPGLRRRPSF